jgi:hypothetical protein
VEDDLASFLKNFEARVFNPFLNKNFQFVQTKPLQNGKLNHKLYNVKLLYTKRNLTIIFEKKDYIFVLNLIINISTKAFRTKPKKEMFLKTFYFVFPDNEISEQLLTFEKIYNGTLMLLEKKNQINVIFSESGPIFNSFEINLKIPIFF